MQMHSYLLTGTFPWGGIRYAGRHFTSTNLLKMIQEWGEAWVIDACKDLDLLPYDDELSVIENYLIKHDIKY
jgi:hypothetical protein